jgi:ankyrin repeat protein
VHAKHKLHRVTSTIISHTHTQVRTSDDTVSPATTSNRNSALHAAAEHGKTHFVRPLLHKGISVCARDFYGASPLHSACAYNYAACAEALLDCGADINAVTNSGATAALAAALHGSTECLQLLAERGADLSARDQFGHTVLHAAAAWGRLQCVTLLLSYSKDLVADVNATSLKGDTPLMHCIFEDIQDGLGLEYEDDTEADAHTENASACAQLLLDSGASVAPDVLPRISFADSEDRDNSESEPSTAGSLALSKYITALRSAVAAHTGLLTVHTEACSVQQSCGTAHSAVATVVSAAATGEVQQHSSITVQLVHAVTGVKAAKLYKLELCTLELLLAVQSSAGQTSSVLLNLLRPPAGWRTQEQQQQQCDTVELKYDGKYT